MVIELTILYFTWWLHFSIATELIQQPSNQSRTDSHIGLLDNAKLFDNIKENLEVGENSNNEIADIKAVLSSLLSKVNALEKRDTLFARGKLQ